MIVDTSAVIAVLRAEPEADRFIDLLATGARCRMSAATLVEVAVVVDANRDPVLSRRLDELIDAAASASSH